MSKFIFEEFNQRRHMRGAEAARVTWVDDQGEEHLLWMNPAAIRGNILQFGPHYGLLVAASHYHMKADQLVALHRSKGKNKTFLQPTELARDRYGFWAHPDYPAGESDGGASFDAWASLVDHEHSFIMLGEDDGAEEISNRYFEGGVADVSDWQPELPAGEGWFVGSIYDTEDGPVCVWLRKLEAA